MCSWCSRATRVWVAAALYIMLSLVNWIVSFLVKCLLAAIIEPFFILLSICGIYGVKNQAQQPLFLCFWGLAFHIILLIVQFLGSVIFKTPIFMADAEFIRRVSKMRVDRMWPFVLSFFLRATTLYWFLNALMKFIQELNAKQEVGYIPPSYLDANSPIWGEVPERAQDESKEKKEEVRDSRRMKRDTISADENVVDPLAGLLE